MSQRPRGLPNIPTLLTLLPHLVLCLEAQALCRDPCNVLTVPQSDMLEGAELTA